MFEVYRDVLIKEDDIVLVIISDGGVKIEPTPGTQNPRGFG